MCHSFLKIQPSQCLATGISLGDNPVMAGVKNLFLRRNLCLGKSCRAGNNLEGGARRVLTGNGLVIHRIVRVVVDYRPILGGNAVDEKIGVKSWTADYCQHLTGLRVQCHGCRCMGTNLHQLLIYGLFRGCLNFLIYGQVQVIAGNGIFPAQHLHRLAGNIHLYLLATVSATQVLVIDLLKPELADDVTALVALILLLFQLRIADFAYIAIGMGALCLVNIIADRQNLHYNPRIQILLLRDNRSQLRPHIGLDADGVKAHMGSNLAMNFLHRHIQ